MTDDYKILSGKKLIDSMRYSGYKNPTHAVAELIDNSIEAGAKHVELLCMSEWNDDKSRYVVKEIAVLDDGDGMDKETLRRALKFGDGTRSDTGSIGRFGVGLPASSLSQCRRVDVYTWRGSSKKALHTYLDLDKINEGHDEVPVPTRVKLPEEWRKTSKHLSEKSGTIVIWSKLDKFAWKRSSTIFKHSEFLVGRIYRKFLTKGLSIRMAAYTHTDLYVNPDQDDDSKERYVKPNDPLYLMTPSSTPGEWGKKPMFSKDGDKWEDKIPVTFKGRKRIVTVRYSVVKPEVRDKDLSGATPHGKHAGSNIGISIIRANRELDMDVNLVTSYDPRERWWGAEIDFPTTLDDFFGVTNSKQGATTFSDMAKSIREVVGNKGEQTRIRELREDGDLVSAAMAELVLKILPRIRNLSDQIKVKARGTRTQRHTSVDVKIEDIVAKKRKEEGHPGRSDESEKESEAEREQGIRDELINTGSDEKDAELKARNIIQDKDKFVWTKTTMSGSQFFDVTPKSGIIHIKLNVNHAAYKNLVEVVEEMPQNINPEIAYMRLNRAREGLRLLLASWGRYEDETFDDKKRREIADYRYNWGSVLEEFLEPNRE